MKNLFVLITALLISICATAYEWDGIGPADAHVNSFNTVYYNVLLEILCTSDGILINEGGNWIEYTTGGLPAWNAVGLDPDNILVILGAESYSDGVYKFNLTSHQFELVERMYSPNFLHYCEFDSTYYVGEESGMWKSADGISYTSIDYFNTKICRAFAWSENHFVVSTDDGIYFSTDSGENWLPTQSGLLPICDLSFHEDGTLYGIFPGVSNSSGLWSSNDYGENWNVELWEILMSSVAIDTDGNIFVGWDNAGITRWDPASQELAYYNEGLPNLHVNKITKHSEIDCINIVACTDSGAYMLTNYPIGIEEENQLGQYFSLSNYPNPFDQSTTIVFSVDETCSATLKVYNMLGNELATLFSGIAEAGQEYKFEFSGNTLAKGIYYYQLKSAEKVNAVKKMLVR